MHLGHEVVAERVTKLLLAGAPAGLKRPGVPLRLLGLPLIGQPLGRRLMSKPTRDGNPRLLRGLRKPRT